MGALVIDAGKSRRLACFSTGISGGNKIYIDQVRGWRRKIEVAEDGGLKTRLPLRRVSA